MATLDSRDERFDYVVKQMDAGVPRQDIVKLMVARGRNQADAEHAVAEVYAALDSELEEAGRRNVRHGAGWLVVGVILTLISYFATGPGGTFIVTWGAILYGGIQFFKGRRQLKRD
ncbi:MAG: hypothetical protein R3B07_05985 [Polyangiaceae bacterium]